MNIPIKIVFGIVLFMLTEVKARPVSYPGGWTLMLKNNNYKNSVHAHYSLSSYTSLGYRFEYLRENNYSLNAFQINRLLKRWNEPNSQANLYIKSAIGNANSYKKKNNNKSSFAGFFGFSADWENQRYFISYDNRYIEAGEIDSFYQQSFRFGIAPYIGDYGDLHTWLMIKLEHIPEAHQNLSLTPHIRLFKGFHLLEIGANLKSKIMLNYIFRY